VGDFTSLDSFFAQVVQKISLLEHQTDTTIKLYEQEKMTAQAVLDTAFERSKATVKVKYDEAYDSISGSDDVKHSYAAHESGWDYYTDLHALESEQLDTRFAEMADNLHKSTIISIYIFLEAELKRLCHCWKMLMGHNIDLTDFSHRDYLSGSYKYLELVMGINLNTFEAHRNKLTDLQNLRNRLIHDGGVLTADKLKSMKKVVDSSKKGLICEEFEDGYLLKIVTVEYVKDWYNVVRQFFEDLFWLIDEQSAHRFLQARMQYLFGLLNRTISIDGLKVVRYNNKRELQFIVDSNDFEHLYQVEVKLLLKNGTHNHVRIDNKVARDEQIDRLVRFLTDREDILWDRVLSGFIITTGSKEVQLTIR